MNLKHCPWCNQDLPATSEYFATDKTRFDSFCHACKACQLKRRAELRATAAERKAYKQSGMKRCTMCQNEFPATLEYFYQEKRRKSFCLKSICKNCQRKKSKERPVSEKEKERAKRYAKEHRNQRYENHKAWRLRNLEARREAERQQKRRDPKRYERSKEWNERNPDKVSATRKQYRVKASDKLRLIQQRYASRKAGLPDNFTEQDWQFALDYFGGCCAVCERPQGLFHTLAMDHWVALSDLDCPGTIPANIAPLCHGRDGCNNSKHNRNPEEWLSNKFGEKQSRVVLAKIHEFFSKTRRV